MDPERFSADVAARIGLLLDAACPGVERPGLLVALSGGPDSTALLLAALRWSRESGGELSAAHLHHGLRGAEADGPTVGYIGHGETSMNVASLAIWLCQLSS